jgi:hypothetical protein
MKYAQIHRTVKTGDAVQQEFQNTPRPGPGGTVNEGGMRPIYRETTAVDSTTTFSGLSASNFTFWRQKRPAAV